MRFRQLWFALPALLLLAVCGPLHASSVKVKAPGAADLERVRQHQLALVLLQATASVDAKRSSPDRLALYVAKLDDLGAPTQVFPAALTNESARQGWMYLLLSPGTYYLLVLPPGSDQNPPAVGYDATSARFGRLTQYEFKPGRGGSWSLELMAYVFANPPADFVPLPGFWLQVPSDAPVVYAGSLSTGCKAGRGLFGDLIDSCADFELASDVNGATELAAAALPGLAVTPLSLVTYGHARPGAPVPSLATIPVASGAQGGVGAAFTGAQLESPAVLYGGTPVVGTFNLISITGAAISHAAAGHQAQARAAEMQPCVARLSETVAHLDLPAEFASALSTASGATSAARDDVAGARAPSDVSGGGAYRLSAAVPILRLREGRQSNRLALELGVDLRLEQVDSKRLDYYGLLLSGPDLPRESPFTALSPLYEIFVPGRAESRAIADWCGDGGAGLLTSEIELGLQRIAEQVVRDLH